MKVGDLVRYRHFRLSGEFDDHKWYGPALLLSHDKLMKAVVLLSESGDKIYLRSDHVQKLGRKDINKS